MFRKQKKYLSCSNKHIVEIRIIAFFIIFSLLLLEMIVITTHVSAKTSQASNPESVSLRKESTTSELYSTTTTEGGAQISLSVSSPVVKKGEVFTVVCRVMASTGVLEADFYVDYNTSILEFVEGGAKAVKETGGVHIQSTGNTDYPVRRTFSLQFLARGEGDSTIFIRDGAHVTDGDGASLSVVSKRIEIEINETGEADTSTDPADGDTPPGGASAGGGVFAGDNGAGSDDGAGGDNRVLSIRTNALSITPDFDPIVRKYEVEIGPETDIFFIDYELADSAAKAKVKGNKNLNYGSNRVRLIVKAPNGDKRTYVFMVTRMAARQERDEVSEFVSPAATDVDTPLDKGEGNGYSIILYIIILLLAVFSIAMVVLVRRQRRELDYYYEEEEREDISETKDDRRGGEGSVERGEIRREDGESRYRY